MTKLRLWLPRVLFVLLIISAYSTSEKADHALTVAREADAEAAYDAEGEIHKLRSEVADLDSRIDALEARRR